ncbi:MAG: DNA/RNA nuclease SfsA [Pseudomonadota bacterium]
MRCLTFNNLVEATWVERRKRFMLDVTLPDGAPLTAHCPNTGAMTGLCNPGARVLLSVSDNPKRKYSHTLEAVEADGVFVGVNTQNPNKIVGALAKAGHPPFPSGATVRPEVRYGKAERIDFLIEEDGAPPLFVEVKNVHLVEAPGVASFPDCVTARGAKHLGALANEVAAGHRALMVYLVQRGDVSEFRLARAIDPAYADAFDVAQAAGVAMVAIACDVTAEGIDAVRTLPIAEPGIVKAA